MASGSRSFPFTREYQLNEELDDLLLPGVATTQQNDIKARPVSPALAEPSLPGNPHITLSDTESLTAFLSSEFVTPDLDAMAPYLWVMSTQSHANISSIHHQRVKGREIVITEDPRLHLVWFYNRIFLKPLPPYLLSRAFWETYLLPTPSSSTSSPPPSPSLRPLGDERALIARAALGYLRTYTFLIRHESDFDLARALRLIPASTSWHGFAHFTAAVSRSIKPSDVSPRYAYGELRLTRLNLYIKFILRKWHFQYIQEQYGQYFARFWGPLLGLFTFLSLMLNAMQVGMAAQQSLGDDQTVFWGVCWWFSVVAIVLILAIVLLLFTLWVWKVADEWIFALKARRRRKIKSREEEKEMEKEKKKKEKEGLGMRNEKEDVKTREERGERRRATMSDWMV
jgi:hypothetical protein